MRANRTVGIDIGGTYLRGALFTPGMRLGAVKKVRLPQDPNMRLQCLLDLCGELAPGAAAIGIAVAGIIADGRLVYSANHSLPAMDLASAVQEACQLPVRVMNDAQAVGLAEARAAGSTPGFTLVVTVGTGIGGALVLDRRLIQGQGHAGEIGHITVDRNGRPCGCGSRGCLELYASGAALRRAASELARDGEVDRLLAMAASGEPAAQRAIHDAAGAFADGINSVAATIAPSRVILGGGVMSRRGFVARMYSAQLRSQCWLKETRIQFARNGDAAGVVGAALAVTKGEESMGALKPQPQPGDTVEQS